MPPVFQPEVAARAIVFTATHCRREAWCGWPTVKAILASKLAPRLLDHVLARSGYSGQLTEEFQPADAPANLFSPPAGIPGSHGRFDAEARTTSSELVGQPASGCACCRFGGNRRHRVDAG